MELGAVADDHHRRERFKVNKLLDITCTKFDKNPKFTDTFIIMANISDFIKVDFLLEVQIKWFCRALGIRSRNFDLN